MNAATSPIKYKSDFRAADFKVVADDHVGHESSDSYTSESGMLSDLLIGKPIEPTGADPAPAPAPVKKRAKTAAAPVQPAVTQPEPTPVAAITPQSPIIEDTPVVGGFEAEGEGEQNTVQETSTVDDYGNADGETAVVSDTTGQSIEGTPPITKPQRVPPGRPSTATGQRSASINPLTDITGFDAATLSQILPYYQSIQDGKKGLIHATVAGADIVLRGVPVYWSRPKAATFEKSAVEIGQFMDAAGNPQLGRLLRGYIATAESSKCHAYKPDGMLMSQAELDVAYKSIVTNLQSQGMFDPDEIFTPGLPKEAGARCKILNYTLEAGRPGYPTYWYKDTQKPAITLAVDPRAPAHQPVFVKPGVDTGAITAEVTPSAQEAPTPAVTPRIRRGPTSIEQYIDTPPPATPISVVGQPVMPPPSPLARPEVASDPESDMAPPPATTSVNDDMAPLPQANPTLVTQGPSPLSVAPNTQWDIDPDISPESDTLMHLFKRIFSKAMGKDTKNLTTAEILASVAANTQDAYLRDLLECIIARLNGVPPHEFKDKFIRSVAQFFHFKPV